MAGDFVDEATAPLFPPAPDGRPAGLRPIIFDYVMFKRTHSNCVPKKCHLGFICDGFSKTGAVCSEGFTTSAFPGTVVFSFLLCQLSLRMDADGDGMTIVADMPVKFRDLRACLRCSLVKSFGQVKSLSLNCYRKSF